MVTDSTRPASAGLLWIAADMNKYAVELIATFFLFLTIGTAAVLGTAGALAPLAIGATLVVMVYAGGHISGAHYNPAVTLALFIRGRCEGKEIGPYLLRSEEHTSELQSRRNLVCRLLLEKKKRKLPHLPH